MPRSHPCAASTPRAPGWARHSPDGCGVVELAGPAMLGARGRSLTRGMPAHAFESGIRERTTLSEFDSVAAAVAAYSSPAYQEALRALGDGAERDLRMIEAVS